MKVKCPVCHGRGHGGHENEYEECGYCHGEGLADDDAVTRALATVNGDGHV